MSVSSHPFPFRPPRVSADPASGVEIVELKSLGPENLEGLWTEERRHWKESLYWDSEPATALVRSAVRRRRLPGKVILAGGKVVGCGYYLIDGGVTSPRVVPSLDEVEDRHASLGVSAEGAAVDGLCR